MLYDTSTLSHKPHVVAVSLHARVVHTNTLFRPMAIATSHPTHGAPLDDYGIISLVSSGAYSEDLVILPFFFGYRTPALHIFEVKP